MNVFTVTGAFSLLVAAEDEEDARKKAMAHIDWEMDEEWLDADDTGELDDGSEEVIR